MQNWLIEHSGRTAGQMRRAGKGHVLRVAVSAATHDSEPVPDEHFHRVLSRPRQIPVIVAGAKNAGISMVVRSFGEWSGVATPVGEKIK